MKQQGFEGASARTCDVQYPALMFQPRVIGVLVLAGVLLQASTLFLTVSAVLWWSALMPRLNPFDRLYNSLVAARKGLPALTAAPGRGTVATLRLGPMCVGGCLTGVAPGAGLNHVATATAPYALPW